MEKTPLQNELERTSRLTRERFSVASMSNTKWRLLIDAISASDLDISKFVVKFVDVVEPTEMDFPPGLQCPYGFMDTIEFGPVELNSVEWVIFDADITETLDPTGKKFPLTVSDNCSKITGYNK